MCGIAGYISVSGRYSPDKKKVKIMTDVLRHRGPDAEGQWTDDRVALGHRRLSIIDLDASSNQPLLSHDGRFIISFNGEIYNYIEIKEELKKEGHTFNTNSDTEVIIEAYRRYGEDCVKKFNGMWAFALYDIERAEVLFSRDRFGIKPLYTYTNDDCFVFASEMKSIRAVFTQIQDISETWIYRYINGKITEDIDEECYYKDIKRFPQSYNMMFDLTTGEKRYKKYWEVNEKEFYERWVKGKNPFRTFRTLFENAVKLRLRADVEVGVCLSGGIDSSGIVGVASKQKGDRIHTFSSVYNDSDCNEEFYIRKVNEKWNTIPHYIKPDETEEDFNEYIKDCVYHHDQPVGGASLYSQYMVMKGIKGHVKVVLDGQGADEMFAGYLPFYSRYLLDLAEKGDFWSKKRAIRTLAILTEEWPHIVGNISTDVIVRLIGIKNTNRYIRPSHNNEARRIRRDYPMFTDDFLKKINMEDDIDRIKCSSHLNTELCNQVISTSIPCLLHNEDANSMAFSIETRVPFLDYRLVEFSMALDGKYKIKNQWTKWVVRRALKKYLPKEVYKRKNKMGFPAPFARWLREGKSKDEIKGYIFRLAKRGIIPEETIKVIYNAHMEGRANFSNTLFRFYCLELWMEMDEGKLD